MKTELYKTLIDKENNNNFTKYIFVFKCPICNRIYYSYVKKEPECHCNITDSIINNKKILDIFSNNTVLVQCINCKQIYTMNYNMLFSKNNCYNCDTNNIITDYRYTCCLCKSHFMPKVINLQRKTTLCPKCYEKNMQIIRIYDTLRYKYDINFSLDELVLLYSNNKGKKISIPNSKKSDDILRITDFIVIDYNIYNKIDASEF